MLVLDRVNGVAYAWGRAKDTLLQLLLTLSNPGQGTGVLVLDRVNGVAYVGLSERADRGLAEQWVDALGYKVACYLSGISISH